MSYTKNLSLELYNTTTDAQKPVITWRNSINGENDSAFIKIDDAFGELKERMSKISGSAIKVEVVGDGLGNYSTIADVDKIEAYKKDDVIALIPDTDCIGNSMVNINNLGNKPLMKVANNGTFVVLEKGDLKAKHEYYFRYDGSVFIWQIGTSAEQLAYCATTNSTLTAENVKDALEELDVKLEILNKARGYHTPQLQTDANKLIESGKYVGFGNNLPDDGVWMIDVTASSRKYTDPTTTNEITDVYIVQQAVKVCEDNGLTTSPLLAFRSQINNIWSEWVYNSPNSSCNNKIIDINNLKIPFKKKTYQLKGQMHCHSTTSDGSYTPEKVLEMYKNAGYDFCCLTDHDALNTKVDIDGIVHIRGIEFLEGDGHSHICGYNIEKKRDTTEVAPSQQGVIDFVKANGGMTSIAHPKMGTIGMKLEEAIHLKGYDFVEICTGFDKAEYSDYIDSLLMAGKNFNLLAVDDFHSEASNTFNYGYIVVNADSKSPDVILNEIKNGNYYSSNGNDIDITVTNNVIKASSSNISNFRFITDVRTVERSSSMSEEYTLIGDESFIRIEAIDISTNKKAWSNPIILKQSNNDDTSVSILNNEAFYNIGKINFGGNMCDTRNTWCFTSDFSEGTCVSNGNGVITLSSGNIADGNDNGLIYSVRNKNYENLTMSFIGELERVSGTDYIEVNIYMSDGNETDYSASTNRLNKSNIFYLNKVGEIKTFKIDFTVPIGFYNMCFIIRLKNSDNIIKIKNVSVTKYVRSAKEVKIDNTLNHIYTNNITNPNLLINGGFQIWQRGEQFISTARSDAYTADRWLTAYTGTVLKTHVFSVPALQYISTTLDEINLEQVIEKGVQKYKGKTLTLSWESTVSTPVDYTALIYSYDKAYNALHFFADTISYSPNKIEKHSISFNIPKDVSEDFPDLRVRILRKPSVANNTINIMKAKLEIGNNVTPFIYRNYSEELLLCQRYYIRWNQLSDTNDVALGYGIVSQNQSSFNMISLPTPLRIYPTITFSSMDDLEIYTATSGYSAIGHVSLQGLNLYSQNNDKVTIQAVTSQSMNLGGITCFQLKRGVGKWFALSAEIF